MILTILTVAWAVALLYAFINAVRLQREHKRTKQMIANYQAQVERRLKMLPDRDDPAWGNQSELMAKVLADIYLAPERLN